VAEAVSAPPDIRKPGRDLPAPQDRLVTLPQGLPALTLGWGCIRWMTTYLRHANGPRAGQRWQSTESQVRFLLWWYSLTPEARWEYDYGVRRLAKGSGKSPFAAAWSILELCGPVRPALDDQGQLIRDPGVPDELGGVLGRPVMMPLVQIAATSESQTANTMRQVRAMTGKKSKVVQEYGLDPGKTVIYTPGGGQLENITSSATAAEGAETTAAVLDEPEHWVPSNGGPLLAEVIDRNLGKSGSRAIATCNAWEPGIDSVAEKDYDAWVAQEEGRTISENKILYDARLAPPGTKLDIEDSLERAIEFVYGDCFWIDQRNIKGKILNLRTRPEMAKRFYLNWPESDQRAWTTQQEWALLADRRESIVKVGDEIVAFFDGSRTQDATALIGCHVETGHVFTIDVWEPVQATRYSPAQPVPVEEVDAVVDFMFRKWNVCAFFGDVREWESFTRIEWPKRYQDRLKIWAVPGGNEPQPIAWDMRSGNHIHDFTKAAELTLAEIEDRKFTQDGDSRTSRHVVNMRRAPNKWGVSVSKESRTSSKKIDAGVCVIGARMVRRLYLAWKAQNEDRGKHAGRVWGFD
jgi:hypothetical protein